MNTREVLSNRFETLKFLYNNSVEGAKEFEEDKKYYYCQVVEKRARLKELRSIARFLKEDEIKAEITDFMIETIESYAEAKKGLKQE